MSKPKTRLGLILLEFGYDELFGCCFLEYDYLWMGLSCEIQKNRSFD